MAGKNPRLCCLKGASALGDRSRVRGRGSSPGAAAIGVEYCQPILCYRNFLRRHPEPVLSRFHYPAVPVLRSRHADSSGSAAGSLSALQNADPGSRGRLRDRQYRRTRQNIGQRCPPQDDRRKRSYPVSNYRMRRFISVIRTRSFSGRNGNLDMEANSRKNFAPGTMSPRRFTSEPTG